MLSMVCMKFSIYINMCEYKIYYKPQCPISGLGTLGSCGTRMISTDHKGIFAEVRRSSMHLCSITRPIWAGKKV